MREVCSPSHAQLVAGGGLALPAAGHAALTAEVAKVALLPKGELGIGEKVLFHVCALEIDQRRPRCVAQVARQRRARLSRVRRWRRKTNEAVWVISSVRCASDGERKRVLGGSARKEAQCGDWLGWPARWALERCCD